MADTEDVPLISVGHYIIINRKGFNKVHLLTENSFVHLGKDKVNLKGIMGHPYWSTFKMVKGPKREFTLSLCDKGEIVEAVEVLKTTTSGEDNRKIWDDGTSQLLTTEKIVELRDSGLSSEKIVGHLIENSKSFHNKTEYSQEKYLKKKGAKYFEYITIKKPTIRLLSDVFVSKDPAKVLGLRIDSLSQIVTAVNLQPNGKYILYENGLQGLVAATLINHLSDGGRLIHIVPGKHPQKHAILAMNFTTEQLNRVQSIKLATLLGKLLENGTQTSVSSKNNDEKLVTEGVCKMEVTSGNLGLKPENSENVNWIVTKNGDANEDLTEKQNGQLNEILDAEVNTNCDGSLKRKKDDESDSEFNDAKKLRWEQNAEEMAELMQSKTCDGVIIVCKEHPSNILIKLLPYIAPSRPFVVFNLYREPLTELYVDLKLRHDIVNLRLTETWMRSYQVLPDRTHPDVLMSGNSGFLLTGILVNNQ